MRLFRTLSLGLVVLVVAPVLALARALFDIYLGPDPIVKAAKERALGALAGVLEQAADPGGSR